MSTPVTTTVHHLVGKRFVGMTPGGQTVMIDGETEARTGMSPMPLLLNAVGACAAFDVVGMLAKRKLEIRGYRVEVAGDRADGTPAYYTHIRARHVFEVPGLDQRTADRFVELAMTKYCSVAGSLHATLSFEAVLEA